MTRLRIVLFVPLILPALVQAALQVVIIEGLGGEPRYTEQFDDQVTAVASAAAAMTSSDRVTAFRNGDFTRDNINEYFSTLAATLTGEDRLALFLIGHGSFDDHQYKFNVSGPDLTGDDLRTILDSVPAETQLLVNTGSSSGALHDLLQSEKRTLILATRSGVERHATRFGVYFATGLSEPAADLDKNNIITAAEAFQFAERQVADYYERNGQLATEHPRLEGDNANRFGLARLGTQTVAREDAELQRLLGQRETLNASIEALRLRKDSLSADRYQQELLNSMLELATLEDQIEGREAQLTE